MVILKKSLKKPTDVKIIERKNYRKKKEKLNCLIRKEWTQFRARERISSSVDRSRRRARLRLQLTRACVHG